jgi:hypothetical protein
MIPGFITPTVGRAPDPVPPAFDPASLFDAGQKGFWYDYTDIATLWADTARTTPATVGNPIRAVTDKSGNNNHLTTASSGVSPILRQDANNIYYAEFDVTDDNMTATVDFSTGATLSVLAGFNNRAQGIASGILEMVNSGVSLFRLRQRATGPIQNWDGLLSSGADSLSSATCAVASTSVPGKIVLSTQHDIAGDISTIRTNGSDGVDCTADKGAFTLGTMDINVGKLNFKPGVEADLYCLIASTELLGEDPQPAEYYVDDLMGGGVMPAYDPPGPPLVYPGAGFTRELGGRFPWMAFAQPIAQMSFWADVGVDILDSWNPDVSGVSGYDPYDLDSFTPTHAAAAEAWDTAAIAAGFKISRFPFTLARAEADLASPMRSHVVGWPVQDEAEGFSFDIAPQLALMDEADPTLSMNRVMNNTGPTMAYRQETVLFPYTDQFAGYPYVHGMTDFYPVQQTVAGKVLQMMYRPEAITYTGTLLSLALDAARADEWANNDGSLATNWLARVPRIAFHCTGGLVEPYQQDLRIPTPEEVRFEIADSIVMGAGGISFFPQRFEASAGPGSKVFTSHNGTPSDVKAQLITTITRWRELETAFDENLLIDPDTFVLWPAVYRWCPDTDPSDEQDTADSGLSFVAPPTTNFLPGPFQGSRREVTGIGSVYFMQNLMNEAKTLTDATWGFSGVNFAARETLIFFEGDLANAVWSDINGIL